MKSNLLKQNFDIESTVAMGPQSQSPIHKTHFKVRKWTEAILTKTSG